jgi:hypothetical protein
MWLGNSTEYMLIVFSNKKGTANGEQEIMVQGVKVSSVK